MKIALIHYRVLETDGVSLEMDKWKQALIELGHEVIYISGNATSPGVKVIEEITYDDPYDLKLTDECYSNLVDFDCLSLEMAIQKQAQIIKEKFIKIIKDEQIDYLVPNNIFALGKSLPTAIGLFMAIKETNIKVVNHHHDFYWERKKYANPTCLFVKKALKEFLPPDYKYMSHVVINSKAQDDLLKRKKMKSLVVPNVFDFDAPLWIKDDYNQDFKKAFGLDYNDVIFLQATRVTNRKGIELAIDTISKLNQHKELLLGKKLYDGRIITNDTNFVLLVVGLHEGNHNYEGKLMKYAKTMNVKMVMDPTKIAHHREFDGKNKIYSLWDAYAHADIITYPSIYEGWGNQFLEGLFAKKPMIVYEYSVFEADIKPNDFYYATLGNKHITKENGLVSVSEEVISKAVTQIIEYLLNQEKRNECIEQNFLKGNKYYSTHRLRTLLEPLFK